MKVLLKKSMKKLSFVPSPSSEVISLEINMMKLIQPHAFCWNNVSDKNIYETGSSAGIHPASRDGNAPSLNWLFMCSMCCYGTLLELSGGSGNDCLYKH